MKLREFSLYLLSLAILVFQFVSAHSGGDDFTANGDIGVMGVIFIAVGSGWIPLLLGIMTYFGIKNLRDWKGDDHKLTDGISLGVIVFLIFDYLSLSGFLGIQEFSSTNTLSQNLVTFLMLAIVTIVYAGFVLFDEMEKNDMTLYILWAIGLGFHSFSEGIIMGFNLQQGLAPALRFFPIASFLIHKFMEGFTLAALILKRKEVTPVQAIGLSIIAGITIIPGVYFGYVISGAVGKFIAYFYAASFATVMFIIPKFFPVESQKNMLKYYLSFGLGFVILYIGSLIHEI